MTAWPMVSTPQDVLVSWVLGCLVLGWVLIMGGARPAGVALLGSAVACLLAYSLFAHNHLETLVHGAVILGTVGLIVGGLGGLVWGAEAPLDRYGKAFALATVVGGALAIILIHGEASQTCGKASVSCFRGFQDPWVQAMLALNVVLFALLFLLQTARWSRGNPDPDRGGSEG